ncbi:MAG TPA: histidinol-phosphate transaminase [Terriglobales bacterium]|nr:histidinol-phosphate transaminase [Terriglobales bacterium]
MLKARAAIRELSAYRPPLAGRVGLRLDFNENTQGPSPRVLRRMRELDGEDLARYPEREPVERLTADFLGIDPQELLLTNGIDEGIQLLCQTYLEAGNQALVVVPTFAMYKLLAASTGARVIQVPMLPEFRFPTEQLLNRITPETRLVAVANPNNPTGAVAEPGDIQRVAREAGHAAILVDEAYFEFYGETILPEIRRLPNLFVARTFSKAYGMAGLRIGVLAGAEEQVKMIRNVASPYNVNAAALACLPVALEDREFVKHYVEEVRLGREKLAEVLCTLGVRHWPSQANFLLAHFGRCAQAFVAAMASRGILVRDRSSDPGCDGCVRITIGTTKQMDHMLPILESIVRAMPLEERSLA